jgi:(p)ppGpp synthase/HD superfamily hydrolase
LITKKLSGTIDLNIPYRNKKMNTCSLNYEKQKIAIEYTLRGLASADKKYIPVLRAFEIAKKYHSGIRKDGITPEFKHQLNIAGSIINYIDLLIDPAQVLIAAFTHDLVEDYSKGSKAWDKEAERLKNLPYYNMEDLRNEFGETAAIANNCLSKVINGFKKTYEQYFTEMALNFIALIVKAEDRLDNLASMYHVFTLEKQREYAEEVFKYFIPALKEGEKNFPNQAHVYQMLKMRLKQKAISVLETVDTFEKIGFDMTQTIGFNTEKFSNQSHH